MFRKAAALMAGTLAAASLASATPAQAHWHNGGAVGLGIAGGLLGGAIIGSALAEPRPSYDAPVYYDDGPRCFVRNRKVWDTPHAYHWVSYTVCR